MKDEKCSMVSTFHIQESVVVSIGNEIDIHTKKNVKQINKTHVWWSSSITLDNSWVFY